MLLNQGPWLQLRGRWGFDGSVILARGSRRQECPLFAKQLVNSNSFVNTVSLTALHSTALHCTAHNSPARPGTAQHSTALHCTELHYNAPHHTSLHVTAHRCTSLHPNTRFHQHLNAAGGLRLPPRCRLIARSQLAGARTLPPSAAAAPAGRQTAPE